MPTISLHQAFEPNRHSCSVCRIYQIMMSLSLHWYPNIASYLHPLHSRCRSTSSCCSILWEPTRYNPEEEEAVNTLLQYLRQHVQTASIVTLCFYLSTKKIVMHNVELPEKCDRCISEGWGGYRHPGDIKSWQLFGSSHRKITIFPSQSRVTVAYAEHRH